MELEEKGDKLLKEKEKSEKESADALKKLDEEKAAHQATSNALLQEQLLNKSLTEELQKINKVKESLEEKLKEAGAPIKAPKRIGEEQ